MGATELGSRFGLDLVIVGGRDSLLLGNTLRDLGIPVIVNGVFALPRRADSPVDEVFRLPACLEADGSPFEMTTRIEAAFIDGREIDLGNKQTALAAK